MLKSSATTGAFTTAQMKDIFKLVLTAIRQTKRFFKNGSDAGSLWKSDAWNGLLEQLAASEKYGQATGLHAMCKQVRDATRISEPRGTKIAKVKKPEVGVANSEGPSKSKSKVKRKVEEVETPSEKLQKPKRKKVKAVAETS